MRAPKLVPSSDLKERIMKQIREGKLCMRSPGEIRATKICIEVGMALSMAAGAILIGMLIYFLKETHILKFSTLGLPGIELVISTIPYSYILLIFVFLLAAIYFRGKLELSYRDNIFYYVLGSSVFVVILISGIFCSLSGKGKFPLAWPPQRIAERTIEGRVEEVSDKSVLVEEDNGNLVKIIFNKNVPWDKSIEGQYIQAVGDRSANGNGVYFYAASAQCYNDN